MKFTGMFLATLLMVVVTVPSAEARAKLKFPGRKDKNLNRFK